MAFPAGTKRRPLMNQSRLTNSRAVLAFIVVVVLAFSSQLWGQSERARIIGTVTDPQGAIVPGATVTVTNVATGIGAKAITDAEGHYQALELPIGSYKLKVERDGFNTTE